jgi:hypothetical protein
MPQTIIKLKPIVHFREFPFGTIHDPSMRENASSQPWEHQQQVLDYLRSGHVLAYPMGADLPDWFDGTKRANPKIAGRIEGGATPLTDGVWFWPAGLIYFVEHYNVRLPQEFIDHAAQHSWQINKETVGRGEYDYDY